MSLFGWFGRLQSLVALGEIGLHAQETLRKSLDAADCLLKSPLLKFSCMKMVAVARVGSSLGRVELTALPLLEKARSKIAFDPGMLKR